jgi:glucan endo-1,3-alpha-glucosidase
MIANRNKVDVVEVITWNDYGESHYIGPIEGAQPNSQAWVNGFDHQGAYFDLLQKSELAHVFQVG